MSILLSASIRASQDLDQQALKTRNLASPSTEKKSDKPLEKALGQIASLVPTEALLFQAAAAATLNTIPAEAASFVKPLVGLLSLLSTIVLIIVLNFLVLRQYKEQFGSQNKARKLQNGIWISIVAFFVWSVFTENSVLQQTLVWQAPLNWILSTIALLTSAFLLIFTVQESKN